MRMTAYLALSETSCCFLISFPSLAVVPVLSFACWIPFSCICTLFVADLLLTWWHEISGRCVAGRGCRHCTLPRAEEYFCGLSVWSFLSFLSSGCILNESWESISNLSQLLQTLVVAKSYSVLKTSTFIFVGSYGTSIWHATRSGTMDLRRSSMLNGFMTESRMRPWQGIILCFQHLFTNGNQDFASHRILSFVRWNFHLFRLAKIGEFGSSPPSPSSFKSGTNSSPCLWTFS